MFLRTFGCRANQYDSETVRVSIEAAGGVVVDSAAEADAAVFNSCTVTANAEADLRQQVRRAARERPALRTVVMGCAAALDDGALSSLPSVAAVIAGNDTTAVMDALGLPAVPARAARQSGARALLRIQDGCDEHCTFCATTLARGPNRSRPMAELVTEAVRLAEVHPEIVLTGVHIGAYGADTGSSLGALVESLVASVPAARFRLTSLEATEVDPRLRELLRSDPRRVAPYLHAPLQSGSDRVLRRMGRHWYTAERYAAAVESLVSGLPAFGLGADVIAGFPGESDADHAATMSLLRRLPFTSLHVFPYSPRPGTAAQRLEGQSDPAVTRVRATELRALALERERAYRRSRDGGTADVVVCGGAGDRSGLTEDYLTVAVANPELPRGSRLRARLTLSADRLVAIPLA